MTASRWQATLVPARMLLPALTVMGVLMIASLAHAADPKMIVVFVDRSGSTEKDLGLYKTELATVSDRVNGGDRFVVAPISDVSLTSFEAVVDEELPVFSFWSDSDIKYARKLKEIKAKIASSLEAFMSSKQKSRRTAILDALTMAQKLFHGEPRKKVLVILSDMIEDSEQFNFERIQLAKRTQEIIGQQRKSGLLPDLGSVHVYVAGASANSSAKEHDLEAFWVAYLRAAGSDVDPSRYGHTLLNFRE
jgi:hypothetical protein